MWGGCLHFGICFEFLCSVVFWYRWSIAIGGKTCWLGVYRTLGGFYPLLMSSLGFLVCRRRRLSLGGRRNGGFGGRSRPGSKSRNRSWPRGNILSSLNRQLSGTRRSPGFWGLRYRTGSRHPGCDGLGSCPSFLPAYWSCVSYSWHGLRS